MRFRARASVSMALSACASLLGCGPSISTDRVAVVDPVTATARCEGGLAALPTAAPADWVAAPTETVVEVRIDGLQTVPEQLLRDAIGDRVGTRLNLEWVRDDISAVFALGAFEDVRARIESNDGLVLVYEVVERALIEAVTVVGIVVDGHDHERPRAGEIYDPISIVRSMQRLVAHHRSDGYYLARGVTHAHRGEQGVSVCLEIIPGRQRLIGRISFSGNQRVPGDELLALVRTGGGRINTSGGVYDEGSLLYDYGTIQVHYYNRGMIDVWLGEPATAWNDEGRLDLIIPIEEGAVYRVSGVSVEGDLVTDAARYLELVRLRVGERFNRSALLDSIRDIVALETSFGRRPEDGNVLPEMDLDPEAAEVAITFVVEHFGVEQP